MIIRVSVPDRFQLKTISSLRAVLMLKQGEAHHIGGADILPAPLGSEKENRTMGLLGGGDDKEARTALTEYDLRLVVYTAKKFNDTGAGVEDLIPIGTTGLIKAINTFKSDKNTKLAAYASRCIENEIFMYSRQNSKTRLEVPVDEPLSVGWGGNGLLLSNIPGMDEDVIYHDIEDEIKKSLPSNAISRLDPRERRIVELQYGLTNEDKKEMTQKEAVDLPGISQSYISKLEKGITKRLKKKVVRSEQV